MMSPYPAGKVSRGVNISTSVLSEHTDRSWFGNPDEDLALIVRTMTEAFPKEPAKCKNCCTIAQAYCIIKRDFVTSVLNAINWHCMYTCVTPPSLVPSILSL